MTLEKTNKLLLYNNKYYYFDPISFANKFYTLNVTTIMEEN